ncbi:MAG: DUF697 domain-containing protein, partial [Ruminobacter sp.]|nr:DUF697 domain-containing protein [Ruminobacter sp.]
KGFTLNASAGELTEVETDGDAMSGSTTIAETDEDDNHVTPVRFWSSPVLWIMLLLLCYGGLQTYAVIDSAFITGSLTGIFWSAVFIAAFVMSLFCIYREFSSVLLFKQVDEHREEVLHACASGSFDDAVKICRALAADSKVLGGKSWENFSKRLQPHFTPADVFQLYEHQVLRDMDERAKKVIVKRSRENGVIVALSPVAWLDMFLTLARSLRMIREISEIYGLRAGVWGRMQLYRRVARNLILIGMTDLATDAAVDVIGAGIAGKLSESLGQGVAAGIYSTRLGYMTVKAVRPLGISPKVITLAELRRDLLSQGKISELIKSDAGK